jgi:hypothetical protein
MIWQPTRTEIGGGGPLTTEVFLGSLRSYQQTLAPDVHNIGRYHARPANRVGTLVHYVWLVNAAPNVEAEMFALTLLRQ